MYRILIVDDEELIRRGLRYSIKWEEMGFQVADEAVSGQEALEKMEKNCFDVLITDIRMPGIYGLEMAEIAKKKYPSLKVIVISGYDDFDYALSALKLKAEDYILKPIKKQRIKEIFSAIKEELDKERSDSLKQRESGFFAREMVLSRLLNNDFHKKDEMIETINSLEIILLGEELCVLVFVIEKLEDFLRTGYNGKMSFFKNALAEIIPENMVTNIHNYFVVLVPYQIVLSIQDAIRELINNTSKSGSNPSVNFGVGNKYKEIEYIPISYSEAIEALRDAPENGSTFYQDIKVKRNENANKRSMTQKQLISLFESGDIIKINELVEALFLDFQESDVNTAYNWCINSIYDLARCFSINKGEHDFKLINNINVAETMLTKNFAAVKLWYKANLKLIMSALKSITAEPNLSLVKKAQRIIGEEYTDKDLSLLDIAKRLNISSGYLCTIFKQVSGENFVSFLTRIRMENARKLILEGDHKMYEIANSLGYCSPRYFTDTFKKYFGLSPTEYKKRISEE